MMRFLLLTPLLLVAPNVSWGSQLQEPELNQCSRTVGITKCQVTCKRSLGEQCLITHINFEGQKLKSKSALLRAKFQTCKNANLDFQISSLYVELEKLDARKTEAKISAKASASNKSISLDKHAAIQFDETNLEGRLPRTYFKKFINSSDSFVEAEINLEQCGHEDNNNSCKIYGTLVAVTDPNIRCDFHDTTQAGAYVPDKPKASKSGNRKTSIGRIGE